MSLARSSNGCPIGGKLNPIGFGIPTGWPKGGNWPVGGNWGPECGN